MKKTCFAALSRLLTEMIENIILMLKETMMLLKKKENMENLSLELESHIAKKTKKSFEKKGGNIVLHYQRNII